MNIKKINLCPECGKAMKVVKIQTAVSDDIVPGFTFQCKCSGVGKVFCDDGYELREGHWVLEAINKAIEEKVQEQREIPFTSIICPCGSEFFSSNPGSKYCSETCKKEDTKCLRCKMEKGKTAGCLCPPPEVLDPRVKAEMERTKRRGGKVDEKD